MFHHADNALDVAVFLTGLLGLDEVLDGEVRGSLDRGSFVEGKHEFLELLEVNLSVRVAVELLNQSFPLVVCQFLLLILQNVL